MALRAAVDELALAHAHILRKGEKWRRYQDRSEHCRNVDLHGMLQAHAIQTFAG
jgi:hypothetical protein